MSCHLLPDTMILSLLIWYFIPPQLCSPHCTTCVYCLEHTCQIKEQLMHLIFNYCPPPHRAQWENVRAANPQYSRQRSVGCNHRALSRALKERNLNIGHEKDHFPSCLSVSICRELASDRKGICLHGDNNAHVVQGISSTWGRCGGGVSQRLTQRSKPEDVLSCLSCRSQEGGLTLCVYGKCCRAYKGCLSANISIIYPAIKV